MESFGDGARGEDRNDGSWAVRGFPGGLPRGEEGGPDPVAPRDAGGAGGAPPLQDGPRGPPHPELPVDEGRAGCDRCAARGLMADPRPGVANLTFYGGVGEIGGNKILVEDRDARIWLDMGAPFDLGEEYFVEFLQPRD